MKANELMIGDLVIIEGYSRICAITEVGVYFVDRNGIGTTSFDRIEPIPLTTEILEKNGFIRQQLGHFRYENEDNDLVMAFYPKEKNYTEGGYDYIDIYKGRMTLQDMPISYVHELQHALRLCGIDKEIVL